MAGAAAGVPGTVAEVAAWVRALGEAYEAYAATFQRNGVDGARLAALTEDGLKDALGVRRRRSPWLLCRRVRPRVPAASGRPRPVLYRLCCCPRRRCVRAEAMPLPLDRVVPLRPLEAPWLVFLRASRPPLLLCGLPAGVCSQVAVGLHRKRILDEVQLILLLAKQRRRKEEDHRDIDSGGGRCRCVLSCGWWCACDHGQYAVIINRGHRRGGEDERSCSSC